MGSWNETCMLSNMSILPGDEVVWILITENTYADKSVGVEHNDFYFVRSIPLFGTYNDYGEILPHFGQERIIASIEQQFAIDLIPLVTVDHAVEMKDFNFAKLQTWLHESLVKIDADFLYHRETRKSDVLPAKVRKIFIRKDVWNSLLEIHLPGVGRDSDITCKRYIEDVDNLLSDLSILDGVNEIEGEKQGTHPFDAMLRMKKTLALLNNENLFCSLFVPGGPFGSFDMSPKGSARKILSELASDDITIENVRLVFYRLAGLMFLTRIMSYGRIGWRPTTGSGSQTEEFTLAYEIHTRMASLAEREIESQIQKYDSEGTDWDLGLSKKLREALNSAKSNIMD